MTPEKIKAHRKTGGQKENKIYNSYQSSTGANELQNAQAQNSAPAAAVLLIERAFDVLDEQPIPPPIAQGASYITPLKPDPPITSVTLDKAPKIPGKKRVKTSPPPLPQWVLMPQTQVLNEFYGVTSKCARVNREDLAIIKRGDLTLSIPSCFRLSGATWQLLSILLIKYNLDGRHSLEVEFTLDEYMNWRGLADRKEARRQIKSDIVKLAHMTISGKETAKQGKKQEIKTIEGLIRTPMFKNSKFTASLNPALCDMLSKSSRIYVNSDFLKLRDNRNQNLYSLRLAHYLSVLKKINSEKGNKNCDRICVTSLLRAMPDFPRYEKQKYRHFTRKFLTPFEKALDGLKAMLTWEYCNSQGAPLRDEQVQICDYATFSHLLIKITWNGYPQPTKATKEQKEKQKKGGVIGRRLGGS